MISDRGPQFVSKFAKAFMKIQGIEGNPSTAYRPQTDGQAERQNQELETFLRIWVSYHQDDWHQWLSSAQFRYNNTKADATGVSPFFALKGYHPYDGYKSRLVVANESAKEYADRIEKIREEVQAALALSKQRMIQKFD